MQMKKESTLETFKEMIYQEVQKPFACIKSLQEMHRSIFC